MPSSDDLQISGRIARGVLTFKIFVVGEQAEAAKEAKVVARKTGIDLGLAKKMVEVAGYVRNGLKNDECYCTLSTRRLIAWARKIPALGTHKAAKIALLNKLSPEDQTYVNGIIQRVIGHA